MGNAGEARLDVVAMGRDEVTVLMNKVSGELDALKGKLAGYEKGVRGAGAAAVDAAKQGQQMVTSMSAIKGQALFVAGAIGGLVAGVIGLAKAFSENMQAIHAWRDAQKDIAKAIESSQAAYTALQIALGNATEDNAIVKGAKTATEKWEELGPKIDLAHAAVRAFKDESQRVQDQAKMDPWAKLLADRTDAVGKLATEQARAENDLYDLESKRKILAFEIADAIRDQGDQMNRIVGISADIARAQKAFPVPFFEKWPVGPNGKRPPGGRAPTHNYDKDFDAEVKRQKGLAADIKDALGGSSGGGNTATGGGGGDGTLLSRTTSDAEKLAKALDHVGDSVGDLASLKFPELADALSEVQKISADFSKGQSTLAEAVAAGGAAIVANAAKAVGGVRAEAAVRAAFEVGMGFATLTNPIESAGHFTAAALLGAVAAGAGKGGGGGGGAARAGGGSSSGGGSSGPSTIVYNFPMLIGDRQTLTTTLRQSGRSSAGTGQGERTGT